MNTSSSVELNRTKVNVWKQQWPNCSCEGILRCSVCFHSESPCLSQFPSLKKGKMPLPVDSSWRGSRIHISAALRLVWSVYSSDAHAHPLSLSVAQCSCHPPLPLPVSWQLSVLSSAPPSFSAPLEFRSHVVISSSCSSSATSRFPGLRLVFPRLYLRSHEQRELARLETDRQLN